MKKESKSNDDKLEKTNYFLVIIFIILNNLDYFSTYLSIIWWWIEINPVIIFMLNYPWLFFIWKIFFIPLFVYYIVIKNIKKSITWTLIIINIIYLLTVIWNFKIAFN